MNHVGNQGNGGADGRNIEGHKNDAGGGQAQAVSRPNGSGRVGVSVARKNRKTPCFSDFFSGQQVKNSGKHGILQ